MSDLFLSGSKMLQEALNAEQSSVVEKRWESLWKNKVQYIRHDIELTVGSETITCHKFMLASVSEVFKQIFFRDSCGYDDKTIKIHDVKPQALKNIIQFAYMRTAQFVRFKDAVDTLFAAEKYEIPDLVSHCSHLLESNLTINNANVIFQAAKDLKKDELMESAKHLLLNNFVELTTMDRFLELTSKQLCEFLQSDDLIVPSETELFSNIIRWAHFMCDKNNFEKNSTNISKVLGDVLAHIRFPLMEQKDFSNFVEPMGLLSDKDVIKLFKYFSLSSAEKLQCKTMNYVTRSRKDFNLITNFFNEFACGNAYSNISNPGYGFYDNFTVTVDNVCLKGVGFAGPAAHPTQNVQLEIQISLESQPSQILQITTKSFCLKSQEVYFVPLDESVNILPNVQYRVNCIIKEGNFCAWSNPIGSAKATIAGCQKNEFTVNYAAGHSIVYSLEFNRL